MIELQKYGHLNGMPEATKDEILRHVDGHIRDIINETFNSNSDLEGIMSVFIRHANQVIDRLNNDHDENRYDAV
ncbi:unnamed protein product [Caenorhabditis bovis]|uniref:Uncharacterized protein n=1 Tax=Caenorhabditis bovis TaxID=2654633 RepID=A0A8S1FF93_9PELO|nr:unnamed protein product [Caenorhabditis bovis]